MKLEEALFELAVQTIAVQQRLDAQYARDLADFQQLLGQLGDTLGARVAMQLLPSLPVVQESTTEVQAAAASYHATDIQIANTTYARRYRSREIQHKLTATVRRVPFLQEDHGKAG